MILMRVDSFTKEKQSLRGLITDLDALLGCLRAMDYPWRKAMREQLINLESASVDWGPDGYPALPLVNKEIIESATQIIKRLVRDKVYSFDQGI